MFDVQISEQADSDLRGIFEYIAFELLAPENATGQLDRLEEAISKLDHMPEKFRRYEREPWLSRGLRVFPVDNYKTNVKDIKSDFLERINKFEHYHYLHNGDTPKISYKQLSEKRKIIFEDKQEGLPVYWCKAYVYVDCFVNDLFTPCEDIEFENYKLRAPAKYIDKLKYRYGDYMSFPKSGILHHGEAFGRPALSKWAKLNNINMNMVKSQLENILEKIQ